jgi:hypothetical protein
MKQGKIYSIFFEDENACTKYKLKEVIRYLKHVLKEFNNSNVMELRVEMRREPYKFTQGPIRVEKRLVDLRCNTCEIDLSCISTYLNHMITNSHLFKTNLKKYCEDNNIEWTDENRKKYSQKLYKQKYYNKNKDKYREKYLNKKMSLDKKSKL